MVNLNFLWVDFFKVVYSSENEPALIFCFSNLTYWFFSIAWQETVLTHKEGVLELVKEQQLFKDGHKSNFRKIIVNFFHIIGNFACLQVKMMIYFSGKVRLYWKSSHFVNLHASRTVGMCNVKMRNDLIRTQITPQKK